MIWTKPVQRFAASAIRAARKAELPPLLSTRGYRLRPVQNGNFQVLPDPAGQHPAGLVVKQSFWIWPERKLSGNAIDFLMKIEGKSFQEAMRIITACPEHSRRAPTCYDSSERKRREERGNEAKIAR